MPQKTPVKRQPPLKRADLEKTPRPSDRPAERIFAGGGEMGSLIRSKDWAKTPLGPVENWPQSLRTAISIMLSSSFAMVVAWGPDFRFFYNDRYRPIIGAKHPAALGTAAKAIFPEAWDFIGPLFARTRQGEAVALDDVLIPLERYGYLENCYFILSYSPIRDESGEVGGMLAVVAETTERVQSERRLKTLRDLARQASDMSTVEAALTGAAEILAENPIDVPFALFYKLEDDGRRARLKGLTGLPAGGHATPEVIDLKDGSEKTWPLWEALKTCELTVVDDLPARFGSLPGGPYPEPTNMAVIAALSRPGQQNADGVVIFGVSPRRALDDQYRGFYELAADHILTAIRNAVARQEERERLQKLVELDRAKTLFFSNVSHEFRTPLTLILGPLEDMLHSQEIKFKLQPEEQEQLAIIHRNSIRLLRLVNTLLDFSRIEAGRLQAAFEPTDLCELTENLASGFRSAIEKAGLEFRVDCQSIPEAVYVDRDMWEKVVLNLLSNAFKFTFSGGITVTLKVIGETVELSVADTGTGIAPNELQRVFERFHRIEGVKARTHEGTGIGLALVQELVKLHGGSVRAESTVGKGSTFIVTLQKGRDHLPADRIGGNLNVASTTLSAASFVEEALRWLPDDEHSTRLGEPAITAWQSHNQGQFTAKDAKGAKENQQLTILRYAQGQAPEHEGKPKGTKETQRNSSGENEVFKVSNAERPYILIADDNADMRRYLTRLLSERYEVHAVADGETALATLGHRLPDLILSDVMMPNLDGFGLVQKLRSNPETNTIPIILLSARAGEEARVEGMEQGVDDYLIKPFSAGELLARVAAHVRLANIRREAAQALRESEQRFRVITEASPVLVWMSGTDKLCYYFNKVWLDFVGRSLEQERGNGWTENVYPEDFDRCLQVYVNNFDARRPFEVEYRLRHHTGQYRWILDRGVPRFAPDGAFEGYVGGCLDIHDQKEAAEKVRIAGETLRRNKELLDVALAASGTGTFRWNPHTGEFLEFDENLRRLFGFEAQNPARTTADLLAHVHPEDLAKLIPAMDACRNGADFEMEYRVVMPDGSIRWLYDRAKMEWEDGYPSYLVGACTDITSRKNIEQALQASEERLRLAQQAAAIGAFEWDMQTNVNRWTPELEAMYGLPPGGFAGTQEAWERLIHPDDRASALKQVEIGLRTGAPIQAEWRVVWPDGSVHWISGRWQVFKDKAGKPARMAGINIDITSRKAAEEAQRRLAAIVESSDDAIASKDLNGVVTSWNKSAERLFGYKAEEMIGKPITIIIPPELQGDEEMILSKIRRGEKIDHFETVRLNKSGERIEISVTISPVKDGQGNVIGAAKIVRNITENKKIEHALRTAEKLAAAGRLAATVAHEINNPLEAVTNLIYLARQSAGSGVVQEYLASAEEELERVSHLTRQTLGFYRDTRGTTSTSVGSLVTPLLSVFSSRARNKAIEIHPEIKEHPEIVAVPGEIRQLLANLLSNSIDAVDGQGGMIRIRVCGAKDFRHEGRTGVRLTVADSGSGIPPAIRSKLFEPFFTTKMEVGTGLGLWVCQSIVEKHGGRISVKSRMTGNRRGTTFSVFLPLIPQSSALAHGLKQAV